MKVHLILIQTASGHRQLLKQVLRMVMAAALFILILVPSGAAASGYPLTASDDIIADALDFLRGAQQSDGNIGGFATSAWAVMAIAAAGEDPHEWGSPSVIDYLKDNADQLDWNTATDLERSVLAICAAGEDPADFGGHDYLDQLKGLYDGVQIGYDDTLNDDFWGVLALIAAGESQGSAIIQNTCDFIISNQNFDGGWNWEVNGDSDADNTAAAIMAVIAAGKQPSIDAITNGSMFLMFSQNSDGGFPATPGGESNSGSDAWAIGSIVAAGEDPLDWTTGDNPVNNLISLQDTDGAFQFTAGDRSSPEFMTAYAIPALLGDAYPVEPISYQPSQSDQADLAVASVDIPANIYKDDDIQIEAKIINIGEQDITANFICSLLIDGITEDTVTITSLASDNSTVIELDWTPSATGSHTLLITADASNAITEAFESNNNYSKTVEVETRPEKPDLSVVGISTGSPVYAGNETSVTATVENSGGTDIDDSFRVRLYADDRRVDTETIDGLGAGDEIDIDLEWVPERAGSYTLEVKVDTSDDVDESVESNNDGSRKVSVSEPFQEEPEEIQSKTSPAAAGPGPLKPDLEVSDITSETPFTTGKTALIGSTIANIGGTDCSKVSSAVLRVNGDIVDTVTTESLAAGQSTVVIFKWTPPEGGEFEICVITDSGNIINESREDNNEKEQNVTVAGGGADNGNQDTAAEPSTLSAYLEFGEVNLSGEGDDKFYAEYEIDIVNSGNKDIVADAEVAATMPDAVKQSLKIDGRPWDLYEVSVPGNSSRTIHITLTVPSSYQDRITSDNMLTFWIMAEPGSE